MVSGNKMTLNFCQKLIINSDLMQEHLTKYFLAEKHESLLFMLVGLAAIVASIFLFKNNSEYKGMAYPLIAIALILLAVIGGAISANAQEIRCKLDEASLAFAGSSLEQARCLLRHVKMHGRLDQQLTTLPAPLDKLIGGALSVDKNALRRYLIAHNIKEADIGGAIFDPVSQANNNAPGAEPVRYFVIHDVSTPNFLERPFPNNINEAAGPGNNLNRWKNIKKAHVYINRAGESATAIDFSAPWRATKFELLDVRRKGLFLHTELVQSRRSDPNGRVGNDALAPNPGFTETQLDRLALVYVAASVRRGAWLIPAFHAAIDAGLPDAHDDPQNFDMPLWMSRVDSLLKSLDRMKSAVTSDELPANAVERLKKKYANKLQRARYMEQNGEATTYAGWENFHLLKCRYTVADKDGKKKSATVIMLNPSVEQLARWVVKTCLVVKGSADSALTDKLFNRVLEQSGGQFPVAGIVFEDILPADSVYEIYCFRNGVTVQIKGVKHRGTEQPADEEIEKSLNGEVTWIGRFARLQGTTTEDYTENGGTADVGNSNHRKAAWLEVSRQLYQAAWGNDRNELMIAWARKNL